MLLQAIWRKLASPLSSKRAKWPEISAEVARHRSRILVIDDSAFPYQKLFVRDGYSITKWNDVKDLNQIERGDFDVILLDIHGVGTKLSADQGLGVLRHIRLVCPAQLVIAYSGADFSLTNQPFFDMADAKLAKSDDYVVFKQKVDALLQERFSLEHYIKKFGKILADHNISQEELKPILVSSILDSDSSVLRSRIKEDKNLSAETISAILSIADSAIGIYRSITTGT